MRDSLATIAIESISYLLCSIDKAKCNSLAKLLCEQKWFLSTGLKTRTSDLLEGSSVVMTTAEKRLTLFRHHDQ